MKLKKINKFNIKLKMNNLYIYNVVFFNKFSVSNQISKINK